MPCYKPLQVQQYYSGRTGKLINDFRSKSPNAVLPCGRCLGCRLAKSKEWSIRCLHESQLHDKNVFITLTYDNEHLPLYGDLKKTDFQLFVKLLRQHFRRQHKKTFRFFMCGEYGTENLRPHYHALLFGVDFPDKKFHCTRNENPVHTSEILTNIWGKGLTEMGTVTSQSAGYCARYTLQKQQDEDLERVIPETGEIVLVQKPYNNASNRPGIGAGWYHKFKHDVFPDDFVVNEKGKQQPTPGYYRVLLQRDDPDLYETLRQRRIEKAKSNPDNTPERLAVREKCKQKQIQILERNL